MCEHKKFESRAAVTRLTDQDDSTKITGYRLDLRVWCTDCGQSFEFIGIKGGYSPVHPTVNFNGTELRCPLVPSTEKPDPAIIKANKN
jgi:hypothetical protein